MNFEKCSTFRKDKVITVSAGRTFEIKNKHLRQINEVEVDGCLIDDDRERCDYLFEVSDPMILVVYLELKGKNVEKAYKQLESTMICCKERHKDIKKHCHIVASRVPKSGPSTQVLKMRMKRKYKVKLFIGTQKVTIKV